MIDGIASNTFNIIQGFSNPDDLAARVNLIFRNTPAVVGSDETMLFDVAFAYVKDNRLQLSLRRPGTLEIQHVAVNGLDLLGFTDGQSNSFASSAG